MKTKYFKYAEDDKQDSTVRTVGIRLDNNGVTYCDIEEAVNEAMRDFTGINTNDIKVVCHGGKQDWEGRLGIEFEVPLTTPIPETYSLIKFLGPLFSFPAR